MSEKTIRTFDFSGKKYLVTGASSGLGRDIAIFLSESGAEVVAVGRRKSELESTIESMKDGNHRLVVCDMALENDLSGIFELATGDGKKLDGMVHCAGIIPLIPVNALKRKTIEECMSINFYALLELMRCFSKKKYRENNTSIVEISSIASQYPGKCQTVYAASKAAANAAVQSLALELYPKGIRINSILPGTIDTLGLQTVIKKNGEDMLQRIVEPQIHGLIKMREVSNIVGFMLSDMSSAVTGRIVYADGGYINY